MATTTLSALPYPLSSAAVKNGAADIQSLAAALDPLVNGTSASSSAGSTSGVSHGAGTTAHRRGLLVVLTLNITASSALSAGAVLFVLPSGYRPAVTTFGQIVNISTEANIRCHVNTDGTVAAQTAIGSGVGARGTLVFPIASV